MTDQVQPYKDRLVVARTLLSFDCDPEIEDHVIEAGKELVALGRAAAVGLGELLSVRAEILNVGTDYGRMNELYKYYAQEWGVSKSTVVKAHVVADKYHDVPRPEGVSHTLVYEILSGAESEDDANAGFDIALSEGWNVMDIRVAKALRAAGLTSGWEVPTMRITEDNDIWARTHDGDWVKVLTRYRNGDNGVSLATEEADRLAKQVALTLVYKAGVEPWD